MGIKEIEDELFKKIRKEINPGKTGESSSLVEAMEKALELNEPNENQS